MTIISKIWNLLTSILSNLNNFHSLEVVDRVSETQLQVGENSNWIIRRLTWLKGETANLSFSLIIICYSKLSVNYTQVTTIGPYTNTNYCFHLVWKQKKYFYDYDVLSRQCTPLDLVDWLNCVFNKLLLPGTVIKIIKIIQICSFQQQTELP